MCLIEYHILVCVCVVVVCVVFCCDKRIVHSIIQGRMYVFEVCIYIIFVCRLRENTSIFVGYYGETESGAVTVILYEASLFLSLSVAFLSVWVVFLS